MCGLGLVVDHVPSYMLDFLGTSRGKCRARKIATGEWPKAGALPTSSVLSDKWGAAQIAGKTVQSITNATFVICGHFCASTIRDVRVN